ncbi:hypothetical protein Tel_15780 [Candidatus Tenderia electrophaga]|jgi:TatD DNase family protein|uniref:DNAase n=1 Tax=Candidatus Tenderia electrophaga TaxID=1748243 RepID=A0A0S2TH63_9GAMM|nr:hypothetical protein Tel_15780 [Candidatus Tenderia electrophaga]
MEIIDSHCHLDVEDFDTDREAVLAACREQGVNSIVVPGISAATWARLLQVCRRHEGLYPALGLHPYYIRDHRQAHLEQLEQRLADEPDLVAVGEIGLDFYIDNPHRERQIELFEAQLAIAQAAAMPVIVHVRKAHNEVLKALKDGKFTQGGIMHAYNGSLQQAQEYMDLGFKLGFGGMITYERSRKLRGLVEALPLEAMVLETDAPDMSGDICHGRRNSPQYLPHYLEVFASLREEDVERVAQVTRANVKAVLSLSE